MAKMAPKNHVLVSAFFFLTGIVSKAISVCFLLLEVYTFRFFKGFSEFSTFSWKIFRLKIIKSHDSVRHVCLPSVTFCLRAEKIMKELESFFICLSYESWEYAWNLECIKRTWLLLQSKETEVKNWWSKKRSRVNSVRHASFLNFIPAQVYISGQFDACHKDGPRVVVRGPLNWIFCPPISRGMHLSRLIFRPSQTRMVEN